VCRLLMKTIFCRPRGRAGVCAWSSSHIGERGPATDGGAQDGYFQGPAMWGDRSAANTGPEPRGGAICRRKSTANVELMARDGGRGPRGRLGFSLRARSRETLVEIGWLWRVFLSRRNPYLQRRGIVLDGDRTVPAWFSEVGRGAGWGRAHAQMTVFVGFEKTRGTRRGVLLRRWGRGTAAQFAWLRRPKERLGRAPPPVFSTTREPCGFP